MRLLGARRRGAAGGRRHAERRGAEPTTRGQAQSTFIEGLQRCARDGLDVAASMYARLGSWSCGVGRAAASRDASIDLVECARHVSPSSSKCVAPLDDAPQHDDVCNFLLCRVWAGGRARPSSPRPAAPTNRAPPSRTAHPRANSPRDEVKHTNNSEDEENIREHLQLYDAAIRLACEVGRAAPRRTGASSHARSRRRGKVRIRPALLCLCSISPRMCLLCARRLDVSVCGRLV
jgi:hypothetical protein